jgi:hypothetical protein
VYTFTQDLFFVSNLLLRLLNSKVNSPVIVTIVATTATTPNSSVLIPETMGFGETENEGEYGGDAVVGWADRVGVGDGPCCRETTTKVTVFEVAATPRESTTWQ